jgi:hypothetical protein
MRYISSISKSPDDDEVVLLMKKISPLLDGEEKIVILESLSNLMISIFAQLRVEPHIAIKTLSKIGVSYMESYDEIIEQQEKYQKERSK